MTLASIPSPGVAVWHVGPLPLRAYALCIIAGIIVSAIIAEQRLRSRGAPQYVILDVAVWAVPCGIIGARIYNVATSWQDYFGKTGTGWISTLEIWKGGLGIWGAVAGGAFGAWMACRQLKIPLSMVADCLAPGLPVAQALGRFGNWFNNELYGKRTTLPWGLQVHQMDPDNPGHALIGPDRHAVLLPGLYQPTFLYEVIWDLGTALVVFLADRKFKFGKGRAFALYVMVYTVGRAWIEYLRIDDANHILGLRLNDWTCLIVFIAALIFFLRTSGATREFVLPDADGGFRTVNQAEFDQARTDGVSAATSDAAEPPGSGDGGDADAGEEASDSAEAGPDAGAVDPGDGSAEAKIDATVEPSSPK